MQLTAKNISPWPWSHMKWWKWGAGYNETNFHGFSEKVPFNLLSQFSWCVGKKVFLSLFISHQSLNFSACTFELTKLLHEKEGWFINQRLLWLSAFHEDKIQKKLLATRAINRWTWKIMKQWTVRFYFLLLHCGYDWNLALPIDIGTFNLNVYFYFN